MSSRRHSRATLRSEVSKRGTYHIRDDARQEQALLVFVRALLFRCQYTSGVFGTKLLRRLNTIVAIALPLFPLLVLALLLLLLLSHC